MSRTWLTLDVNYLCYRAFYSTGALAYEDRPTGTLFGFLRDIPDLSRRFGTEDFIFCFDHGKGLREERFPYYKATRRKRKVEEHVAVALEEMRTQVDRLRTEYLHDLGYDNVFYRKGYEADDIMSAVRRGMSEEDRLILVTGDQDVYQLLDWQTAVYHPIGNRFITAKTFKATYGIKPHEWVAVKAIAGCASDDVPGLQGVGEKTAIKFLRGEKMAPAKEKEIGDWCRSQQYEDNIKLVCLPLAGLPPFRPEPDQTRDLKAWNRLCTELGMGSLVEV